jgi:hypothetical protein
LGEFAFHQKITNSRLRVACDKGRPKNRFVSYAANLRSIVQCQRLVELSLAGIQLSDDYIMTLCRAYVPSSNLTTLAIYVSYWLRNPCACGKALAHVLQTTITLQKLQIIHDLPKEFLMEVLQGAKCNSSLVHLHVGWQSFPLICVPFLQQELASMPEAIPTLHELKLPSSPTTVV